SGPGFDPYIPEGLATEGRSGSTEPPFGGISKDFSWYFTPNRFQTGRLGRFGVKCRLLGGERGWRAHQRPTNASQS
ncbi:transposase, partial [Corynebacterium diphtheriae]